MWKLRKSVSFILLASLLILAGCTSNKESSSGGNGGSNSKSGGGETYTIGISQYVNHPSLDAATEGFKKALKESGLKVKYDEQNAQGDPNNAKTVAQNLVNGGVDLIFANATPSAQAAAGATSDIPIVFTSVTDPIGAELVKSMESPGGNVTGTADMHPDSIPNTIKFIDEQMDVKKVGTIYNAGEQNSVKQIDEMKKAIKGTDLQLVEKIVANTSEVKQAADALVDSVDVIYIVTDNTVVSGLESVIQVAQSKDIPLFVGELDSVKTGWICCIRF